ncbi:MAG: HEPN domain-containing protein [Candidatus Lernaella stagnicola]|nr:HEPN domain-containing protein [Candidatus Lernaella stagnicola]
MRFIGTGDVTYILLSGIEVADTIRLSDNVELHTADASHLDLHTTLSACSHPDDIAVAAAFIPRITAQFRVTAANPKELAVAAWNSAWDALLLSAFFRTEIGFNLQCNTAAQEIGAESTLCATNLGMRGLTNSPPHKVTDEESRWITDNHANAWRLLDNERFQNAVHCLATYPWHTMGRVQMAILWAGIEGMFGVTTEIKFRLSLYIARFLQPDNVEKRKAIFDSMKKLYNSRSAAVHGSKIKGDTSSFVDQSADILCKLLRKCAEANAMPDERKLVP